MQKKKNHYHRYRKVKMGKNKDYVVYQCVEPECTHYIAPELLVGKIAQCFYCRNMFTISREQVRKDRQYLKLHCNACTRKEKSNVDPATVDNFLSNLGFDSEAE